MSDECENYLKRFVQFILTCVAVRAEVSRISRTSADCTRSMQNTSINSTRLRIVDEQYQDNAHDAETRDRDDATDQYAQGLGMQDLPWTLHITLPFTCCWHSRSAVN